MIQHLRKLALLAGATAFSLALAEGAVRWLDSLPKQSKVRYLTAYDPELGWSKRPNGRAESRTHEFHVVETTNSQGLRGPEIPFDKLPGVFRVLLLGDSFLEGFTVSFDDLVSEQLRVQLQRRMGVPVEVVNGGTVGYSTDQELLFYRRDGRRYHPDATVLLFTVNDVWFNRSERYWRGSKPRFILDDGELVLTNSPTPPPSENEFAYAVPGGRGLAWGVRRSDAWLGARSAFYRLARKAVADSPWTRRWLIHYRLAGVPGEWKPWSKRLTPALAEAWTMTEALLAKLGDEVEADGSTFSVFYVPHRAAVYPEHWEHTRRAYDMTDAGWDPAQDAVVLEQICRRCALDCIIPLEEFRSEGATKALYFSEDAHWTPEGHRLAARLIAERLPAP